MANEITVAISLQYFNPAVGVNGISASLAPKAATFNIAGKNFANNVMTVPITAGGTAIPVSGLANLGWAAFTNLSNANFVTIMSAVNGTKIVKIPPGGSAEFMFDPSIVAPAAIADTNPVELQYLILEI
jgi:hypothetical protein